MHETLLTAHCTAHCSMWFPQSREKRLQCSQRRCSAGSRRAVSLTVHRDFEHGEQEEKGELVCRALSVYLFNLHLKYCLLLTKQS